MKVKYRHYHFSDFDSHLERTMWSKYNVTAYAFLFFPAYAKFATVYCGSAKVTTLGPKVATLGF